MNQMEKSKRKKKRKGRRRRSKIKKGSIRMARVAKSVREVSENPALCFGSLRQFETLVGIIKSILMCTKSMYG